MEGFFRIKHIYFFGMEMIVWILPSLLYHWLFGIDMIMPYGVLISITGWLVCPGSDLVSLLRFRVGVVPSVVPANFWPQSEENPNSKVGSTVASK